MVIVTAATETRTRTTFAVKGTEYELVTLNNGKTEVYAEYDDEPGLMQFRGYYEDLCVADRKLSAIVHPAVVRHVEANRRAAA